MSRAVHWKVAALALLAAGVLWPAGAALARDQVRIVGSSTVYPFSATVAERVGRMTRFKAPVIESTGSGGGFRTFCEGTGPETVDIVNASRRMRASEKDLCRSNKVTEVTEIKFGYDGIILGNSRKAPRMAISRIQLFLALAKQVPVDGALADNPYRKWRDIDPSLPDTEIRVYGPPPTSGTRDKLAEMVMEEGCRALEGAASLGLEGPACDALREDGAYIESGENDALIVGKLQKDPDAFGIFGFNVLEQNMNMLQGSVVEGVEPTFESISDSSYPLSRPLYFYVKNAHVGYIAGLKEYIEEMTSETAFGEYGYLTDKGLVPLSEDEREDYRRTVLAIDGRK